VSGDFADSRQEIVIRRERDIERKRKTETETQ
jgi:hypothetical protein